MLCLGQERRGLCPWPRRSPASVFPSGRERERKNKQKLTVKLGTLCLLRGVVLCGAVWGRVLLESGGQSGGSAGEGSARPRDAKGVSSASGIELPGAPRAEPLGDAGQWRRYQDAGGYQRVGSPGRVGDIRGMWSPGEGC